jgi:2-methylcitrate dehydratase PrpD
MDLTGNIARFVASPRLKVPAEASAIITNGFLDCSATMVAGQNEKVVQILLKDAHPRIVSAAGASLFLSRTKRCGAEEAALINATSAHALDYDDVALTGHPSAVLVSALLAQGEQMGASGEALIRAYYVGYEVWGELVSALRNCRLHDRGWHPTAILGTIATAAAIAHLRSFDERTCAHAIGMAACLAGGLTASFGSMVKPLQAGRAATNGLYAARLAQAGITASDHVIESKRGFLFALSGREVADPLPSRLGEWSYLLEHGLEFKKYPVCFAAHRAIDGVLRSKPLAVADIASIVVDLPSTHAELLRYHDPKDALEAKFSIEFAVAAALLRRRLGLSELDGEFIRSPKLRALTQLTRVESRSQTGKAPLQARVIIKDGAGGALLDTGPVTSVENNSQIEAKFLDCCAFTGEQRGDLLFERISKLQSLSDIRQLAV